MCTASMDVMKTRTNSQTERTDLGQLDTVLVGWFFWKHTDEERFCRVESELPTVRGGEVYLVKAAACDPKELAETSPGVRKESLDPIVSQARLLPVQSALRLAIGSVLFVQKTRSAGGGLGSNWTGVRPVFPTQHTQVRAC
jgi:hypothetical protein